MTARRRPAQVPRLAILVVLALVATACSVAPLPPPSREPSPTGSPAVGSMSPETRPAGPVEAFAAELLAAGATVADQGAFNSVPLGGRGVRLCVAGQQVSVYLYETDEQRAAVTATIDPQDPSNVGRAIIEWAGNPRLWLRDRIIVLYLGGDPAVEAGITSVLGPPFARGQGRDPGPAAHAC